jgi:citrate lyase beta subunit
MRRFLARSVLFCPADRLNVMEKAFKIGPDVIVLDLEDSVSPMAKSQARDNIAKLLLNSAAPKSFVTVRINCPITTPWAEDDIKFVSDLNVSFVSALIIPKVDSIESLNASVNLIPSDKIKPVWAMIESAKGVKNAHTIAESSHVETLVFGQNDLCKDLILPSFSRDALLYSMSKCILAARAEGKLVIDGVFMDITDSEGLESDCKYGRSLGFDGKSLIHPNQIDTVNRIYTPTEDNVIAARRVIEAFGEAQKAGKSLATLDGRLIEHLHVKQAQDVIRKYESILALHA